MRARLFFTEAFRSIAANLSTTVAAIMTVLIGMFLLGLFIALGTWVISWTDHVKALGEGMLSNEVDSWMTGINSNVEGKQTRIVARYSGSAPDYRARCDEVAAKGYDELRLG